MSTTMSKIDWNQIEDWDKKYTIHIDAANEEYVFTPVERTEGDYIVLADGSRYLDMVSQLLCVGTGQCEPYVQNAIKDALDRYGFVFEAYATDYRARAAKLLIEDVLAGETWAGKVRFVSSGSEAVELALMIAKLYTNRPYIMTREWGYHGWTMGAAGCTALPGYAAQLASTSKVEARFIQDHPAGGFFRAPMPNCYNCSLGHTYPDCMEGNPELPCVMQTRSQIRSLSETRVAAFITEPIPGAASIGAPPPEYFPQVRKMTRELGVLWIVDEVMMGFAKTGKWFSYQNWGNLEPDIVTMAKGLVNSALPAAGVIVSKPIADYLDSTRWVHVATFGSHPVALAAVCANLEYMLANDAPAKFQQIGDYFGKGLAKLQEKHKTLGSFKGMGMVFTVELVKNKETKERFIPDDRATLYAGDINDFPARIVMGKTMEKGVIITGWAPNSLRISCSMNISKEDLDKALDALDYALDYLDTLA
jgi:taurine---2-oxoglutarate transaminase